MSKKKISLEELDKRIEKFCQSTDETIAHIHDRLGPPAQHLFMRNVRDDVGLSKQKKRCLQ